jgi:hypothetical protein
MIAPIRWYGMNDSGKDAVRLETSSTSRVERLYRAGARQANPPILRLALLLVNPVTRHGCDEQRFIDITEPFRECQPRSMRMRKFSFFPLRTTNS